MYPRPFQYAAPGTLPEALSLLRRHREDAKILAGGQSLVPLMKLRLASPKLIVDINRIKGLAYIREGGGRFRVGSMTRMNEVESSALLRQGCPILPETASNIADYQVRNRGTVGGNIAHGDPSNDIPATILALDAELAVRGPTKTRIVPADSFFVDILTTALRPSEILTEVRFPVPRRNTGGAFMKFERVAGDFAIVSVAGVMELAKDGSVARTRIGIGSAGPTAFRAKRAEASLAGRQPEAGAIEEAASVASEESKPLADIRGSVEYKREMVKVFTKRTLSTALRRAEGRQGER